VLDKGWAESACFRSPGLNAGIRAATVRIRRASRSRIIILRARTTISASSDVDIRRPIPRAFYTPRKRLTRPTVAPA